MSATSRPDLEIGPSPAAEAAAPAVPAVPAVPAARVEATEPAAPAVPAARPLVATGPASAAAGRARRFPAFPLWVAAGRIALGLVLGHLVLVLFPANPQLAPGMMGHNGTWFGAFDRYDSVYYLRIAEHGYPRSEAALTAFLPAYSLLVRFAHVATFGALSMITTAEIVSWVAFAGTSVLLYLLVRDRYGTRPAMIAVALLCWTPASLFFLAPYSESLFALEVAAALYLIDRHRFLAAAAVAAIASATSPEAVALTLAIAVTAWLAGWGLWRIIGYSAITSLGLVGYMLYLQVAFGHALEFVTTESSWHRSEHLPFVGLVHNLTALSRALRGPNAPRGSNIPTHANTAVMWVFDDASLILGTVVLVGMLAAAWLGRRPLRPHRPPAAFGGPGPAPGAEAIGRTGPASGRAAAFGGPGLASPARPSPRRGFPASWLVTAGVIVLIAACTAIYPWGSTHYFSTESEERFIMVVVPLFAGAGVFLRRWPGLVTAVVATSIVLAVVFQTMFNLNYWVT